MGFNDEIFFSRILPFTNHLIIEEFRDVESILTTLNFSFIRLENYFSITIELIKSY